MVYVLELSWRDEVRLCGYLDADYSKLVDSRLVYYILSVYAYWSLSVTNQYDMTLGSFGV